MTAGLKTPCYAADPAATSQFGNTSTARMTLERTREHLCPLNPQVDPAILDGRDRGLRNTREFGKLTLRELLELPGEYGPTRRRKPRRVAWRV